MLMRLRSGRAKRIRDGHDRDTALRCCIKRIPKHIRRATIGARFGRHIMAVENEPAIFGDRCVKGPIDSIQIDVAVDQGRGTEKMQIRHPAIDARDDAAGRSEDLTQLRLVPNGSCSVWIREILDPDRGIDRAKVAAVVLDLEVQFFGVEIGSDEMREGMAGDLMPAPMQLQDPVTAYSLPMTSPFADQTARDIERRLGVI